MKTVLQKKRPRANCRLQYNKLIVDHEVFVYNDVTGQVEQVYDSKESGKGAIKAQGVKPTPAPKKIGSNLIGIAGGPPGFNKPKGGHLQRLGSASANYSSRVIHLDSNIDGCLEFNYYYYMG